MQACRTWAVHTQPVQEKDDGGTQFQPQLLGMSWRHVRLLLCARMACPRLWQAPNVPGPHVAATRVVPLRTAASKWQPVPSNAPVRMHWTSPSKLASPQDVAAQEEASQVSDVRNAGSRQTVCSSLASQSRPENQRWDMKHGHDRLPDL